MAAIFFDVDGTLVRFPDGYGPVVESAVESVVGRVEGAWIDTYDEQFFESFSAFDADPYRHAFAAVVDEHDLSADPAALAEALVETEFDAVEPVPGVVRLLPALAESHTLGILTNGVPEVQFGKVERLGVRECFDVEVASHDPAIGATKPDPEIFEAARERVDAEPLVMVGDDPEADVAAARESGFLAMQVDAEVDHATVPDFAALSTLFSPGR